MIKVALVQFDSVPEQTEHDLDQMERIVQTAAGYGARWVMFHEGCLTDYTPQLDKLAEPVPDGSSCQRMRRLAAKVNAYVSFGMSELDGERRKNYADESRRFRSLRFRQHGDEELVG